MSARHTESRMGFATPEEGAAYWFTRDPLTRQEREAREQWLAGNPANRWAYERATALWGALSQVAAHEEMRELRRAALDARPVATPLRNRWWIALAAGLAAVVTAAGLFEWSGQDSFRDRLSASLLRGPNVARHQTHVGERSTVTLKDGSIVTMNTASEIAVDFSDSERTVKLKHGQAYFSVAQETERPFVVIAGGRRITALGTAFDVRLDRDQVQVVLVEGKVAVKPLGMAAKPIELLPGERFVSKDEDAGEVLKANVEASTSWRSGRIVFTDTSIREAVAEVNRYRDRPIVIGDERIGGLKISGTYRVSEVDRFAQALAEYYPVGVATRPSGDIELLWRSHDSSR